MIIFTILVISVFVFYFLIIGGSSLYLLKVSDRPSEIHSPDNAVSVIVPFRNESENLPFLIQSLSAIHKDTDKTEFILVDDHSEDDSFNKASQLIHKVRNLRLVKSTEAPGKKYALLMGVKSSSFENIIVTDADCTHPEYWLTEMISALVQTDSVLVSGGVKYSEQKGFFFRFQALDFLSLVGVGAASFLAGRPVMCNAANMAFKKSLFLEAFSHLHPEHPSGDDIFLLAYAKKHYPGRIVWCYSKNAMVITSAVSDIRSFFRQRMRWASKSIYYDDPGIIILASVVFLTELLSILLPILAFGNIQYLYIFLILFSLKSMIDYIFLQIAAEKTGQRKLLRFYILSALVHPFYILISALGGLLHNLKR